MSFLLGALGSIGRGLLTSAGGYLLDKAKPWLSKLGSTFQRMGSVKVGPTSDEHSVMKAASQMFGGFKNFANGDAVARKRPMLVGTQSAPSDSLKQTLTAGSGGLRRPAGVGNPGAQPMDGVERYRPA